MNRMPQRSRALVALAVALGFVMIAGTTALAAKGLKTKSETEIIDPGEQDSATAKCKRGTKAVSGGLESDFDPPAVTGLLYVSQSRRAGGREWTTTAYNVSGESAELTSYAYCRGQKLKTKSATTEVDLSEVGSVTARCKQGYKAFSGGFAGEAIDFGGMGTPAFLAVRSLKQGKRAWTVAAFNIGSAEGDLTAYVHCRKGKSVRTRQADETLSTAEFDSVEARCSSKQRVVSGGFDTDSDWTETGAYLTRSLKVGKRGWEVTAQDAGGDPHELVAYAYCEKKK